MEELIEEFGDGFKDEFEHQNPDSTGGGKYKQLFKKFWEDKFWDVGEYEIGKENGCAKHHEEIYEPMDQDDIDGDME